MENKPRCDVDYHGTKRWILNNKLHREDGPAIEYQTGHKEWWWYGTRHRENGPAVIYTDGRKEWYINDKLHRLNGPAIVSSDGVHRWWINGLYVGMVLIPWTKENNIDLENLTEVDKALIKITWADYGKYTSL